LWRRKSRSAARGKKRRGRRRTQKPRNARCGALASMVFRVSLRSTRATQHAQVRAVAILWWKGGASSTLRERGGFIAWVSRRRNPEAGLPAMLSSPPRQQAGCKKARPTKTKKPAYSGLRCLALCSTTAVVPSLRQCCAQPG